MVRLREKGWKDKKKRRLEGIDMSLSYRLEFESVVAGWSVRVGFF